MAALAIASIAPAEAQNLRNSSYSLVGKISANGTVRDTKLITVGYFNPNGTITDRNHRQLGRVSADMQVYDAKGTRIGYITVDGAVHDGESRTLGHIDRKTGKVTDASYKIIGYGEDLNIVWIACYFFFGFFS